MKIGTVIEINLYPVKSMMGVAVDEAELWWYGLNGDRKCAFVQSDSRSNFPWLTGREYPDLVRYQAYFTDATDPANSPIYVRTPSGLNVDLEDPELLRDLSEKSGRALHLMRLNRGVFDAMPISIISTKTVQAIGDVLSQPMDARRFRANIVVDVDDPADDFPEANWLSSTLTFGTAPDAPQVQANCRIQRCAMVNIDPDTSARNPAVLKTVAQGWETCAGIYCAAQRLGLIRVGDALHISR